jgi:hypothetical protein
MNIDQLCENKDLDAKSFSIVLKYMNYFYLKKLFYQYENLQIEKAFLNRS